MLRNCRLYLTLFLLLAVPVRASDPPAGPLTLDEALSLALAQNPAILKAAAAKAASTEEARMARADRLARLSASYSYNRLADAPYANFNGNRVVVGSEDEFAWQLKLSQPLFTGFALSAKSRLAELGVELGEVER